MKKVTTERAPVAPAGGAGRRERGGLTSTNPFIDALQRQAGGDLTLSELSNLFRPARETPGAGASTTAPETPAPAGGAAAAAGVLTAVDEDAEGEEEATVPKEFDYYTDDEE